MEDTIKTIKAYLYERVSSPLLRTFTASWAIWNYKLLLVLISSMDVKEKIQYIPNTFYPDQAQYLLHEGFTYPLVSAILFLFLVPWPSEWAYEYTLFMQRRLRDLKKLNEGKLMATQQEIRKLNRDIDSVHEQYVAEIEQHKIQISNQIDRIEQLEEETLALKKDDEYSWGHEIKILIEVDKSEPVIFHTLRNKKGIDNDLAQENVERLIKNQLLRIEDAEEANDITTDKSSSSDMTIINDKTRLLISDLGKDVIKNLNHKNEFYPF